MARRRTQRAITIAVAVLALGATTMTGANAAEDPVRQVQAVANKALGDVGTVEVPRVGGVGAGVGDVAPPSTWPPAGFALTSIQWSMSPGDTVPTFTPPNPATSHPTNWECTTSVTGTYAHASCMPTSAPDPGTVGWSCYDPFVVVDVLSETGSDTGDGVTGRSKCGTTAAICHAATGISVAATTPSSPVIDISTVKFGIGTPAAHCQHAAFPAQPAPLECDADFYAARPSATWTVRCAPIDP